jgi:hypothetical protein
VQELALRGAESFEGDEAAERKAVDFALSVANGTSGLDLKRLRSARERLGPVSWPKGPLGGRHLCLGARRCQGGHAAMAVGGTGG